MPSVVITLGAGSGGTRDSSSATSPPTAGSAGEGRLPELFVGGEGLARGGRDVLGTLLHEAAHGVASTRSIQDTSRQGRFHNTRFRALAEELGLAVAKTGSIGWSATTRARTPPRRCTGPRSAAWTPPWWPSGTPRPGTGAAAARTTTTG